MKKVLPVLFLISFLAVLVMPQIASAQGPSACCKLGRDINWTSGKMGTVECTVANPCTFKEGIAVGEAIGAGECGVTAVITAACAPSGSPKTQAASCLTDEWGMICLLNTLYGISDWIFVVLIALAVLFVIMGAFQMITAAGSPEKVSSGRQYILYAAIGLAVALLARAIPAIVRTIAGA